MAQIPVNIGSRKQLFIDRRFIASAQGVDLVVNPPVGRQIVMESETPWEDFRVFFSSVVDSGDHLKLYYTSMFFDQNRPFSQLCLAQSDDGVHWRRPELGLFECQGSRKNNIIAPFIDGAPYYDPSAPLNEPYMMIGTLTGMFDPDGLKPPSEIDAQARHRLAKGMEEAKRARDLGADILCDTCDIADNHGAFFSPAQLERFWYPYVRKWTDAVREIGLCAILHSDGNLTAMLPGLMESGFHGLQAIDPIAGIDIFAVKKQVGGKLCLCGNIDLGLLQFGPVEKITEQTAKVCDQIKVGGGFVLGASNAVFQGILPLHYQAMIEAWRQHGRY